MVGFPEYRNSYGKLSITVPFILRPEGSEVRGLDPPEAADLAPRQFASAQPVLQRFRTHLEDSRGLFRRE
jgi:hypothetical protein